MCETHGARARVQPQYFCSSLWGELDAKMQDHFISILFIFKSNWGGQFFFVASHICPGSQKHAFGPFNLPPTAKADQPAW